MFWVRRFILFHDKRHPQSMGCAETEAFLSHLASHDQVAASTQNQALSALVFLYREVLHQELEGRIDALRARKPKRLPTVLTREEVRCLLAQVAGPPSLLLMVQVMYGSGLRLTECLRLRVAVHPPPQPAPRQSPQHGQPGPPAPSSCRAASSFWDYQTRFQPTNSICGLTASTCTVNCSGFNRAWGKPRFAKGRLGNIRQRKSRWRRVV